VNTVVTLWRAVNVGGRRVKMDALRALYESLGCRQVVTYLQSGNVVCGVPAKLEPQFAVRLQQAFAAEFGFESEAILRTATDLATVIAGNPFAGRTDVAPHRLLVSFAVQPIPKTFTPPPGIPEEIIPAAREVYVHFPLGAGQSKLTPPRLDKLIGSPSTARNWNTVEKLSELASQP
jgi:uncharacterized protein (DUF1697 family)